MAIFRWRQVVAPGAHVVPAAFDAGDQLGGIGTGREIGDGALDEGVVAGRVGIGRRLGGSGSAGGPDGDGLAFPGDQPVQRIERPEAATLGCGTEMGQMGHANLPRRWCVRR